MTDQTEIDQLRREMRGLKLYALAATVVMVGAGVAAFSQQAEPAVFDRLTAQRIDIVEPDGTLRAVLTSDAATPGPIIDGREGTRNMPVSGLILFDHEGDEIGGYASGRNAQGDIMVHTMDFGQSEALASFRRIDAEGRGSVGIFLNDQPPADMLSREATQIDWGRIKLQTPERNAEILMTDTQQRPRIRLVVDAEDNARIEVLDAQGGVVFRAPDTGGG
ncbi:hypothetical protein [Brevundimonas lutea]|uniref:hypothetical protein n=1 Tax=Brevundimonas lutea TaxID=2293980 RepID=UPI000F013608|nr:hypothetical protein [Brevundimonas lutea]